jgi:putative intracellular protease/amidase
MVLTGADTWTMKDGTPHSTGFWMEEFVRPHKTFTDAGFDVSIATPQGRTPAVDPLSLALEFNHDDQAEVDTQKAYLESVKSELENTLVLGDVDPSEFDVMFVVGGHGPMQDLAVDPDIGRLMVAILGDQSKVLAAVCHGPASFLSAHDADGKWLFEGRRLTAFSNEEETQSTFAGNAPWLLEDRLRLAGAIYEADPAWTPHAVTDGSLVTGQQNYSAQASADAVMEALRAPAAA